MARSTAKSDPAVLTMALVGFELEKTRIESKIKEIRALLGGRRVALSGAAGEAVPERKPRILSDAARKRIANAQKKRWAEHRRRKAAAAKGE